MSKYFAKFPTTLYSLSTPSETISAEAVTDITKRLGVSRETFNDNLIFFNYAIRDGETPEKLAHRFYNDSEKHWIILVCNNIIDPQFNWPLDDRTLDKYINVKYAAFASPGQSGSEWAQINVESYYRAETTISNTNLPPKKIFYTIDKDSYDSLNVVDESYQTTLPDGTPYKVVVEKFVRTYYEYEQKSNERMRTIRVPNKEYVPELMRQFKSIFGNT